jgi:hypothetical protein
VFKPDLCAVSIADWSELIVSGAVSDDKEVPAWARIVALLSTGYQDEAAQALADASPTAEGLPPDLARELRNQLARPPAKRRLRVLISRAPDNSVANKWLPVADVAAVNLPRARAASVSGKPPFTVFDCILIELEPADDIEALLKLSAEDLLKSLKFPSGYDGGTRVGLITAQPNGVSLSHIPVISAPLGIMDVLTRMRSLEVELPRPAASEA